MWRSQSRYTVSRIECRIKCPQNQRCRAKIALHPPKSRCRTFLRTPRIALSCFIRSRQEGKGWCRGMLVEGLAALLGPENGSRYRGVSQLQSHQSRYSVQLRRGAWGGLGRGFLKARPPHAPLRCLLSPPTPLCCFHTKRIKVGNHEPKKGQAMQRCHEEQSARSKCARLSPLEWYWAWIFVPDENDRW